MREENMTRGKDSEGMTPVNKTIIYDGIVTSSHAMAPPPHLAYLGMPSYVSEADEQ